MRRIVLDTNCLVMALPSRSPYHRVWEDFCEERVELCVSTEILLEYEEIISEKASPYMADIVINALINRPNLIKVEPKWRWNLIEQDWDDNKFVACALAGQAEFIVSNDAHFKVLEKVDFPCLSVKRIEEYCLQPQS